MKKAYIKYLLATLLFGLNGIVAAQINMDSYIIVLSRTLLGSLVLIGFNGFTNHYSGDLESRTQQRPLTTKIFLLASGTSLGISWLFLFNAYNSIGVGTATLLYYVGPVFVILLSVFIYKEKLSTQKISGLLLVVFGMLFISIEGFSGTTGSKGIIYGFIAAIFYAFMVIFGKSANGFNDLLRAKWQLIGSLIPVLIALPFNSFQLNQLSMSDLIWLITIGVVNTGIGCYLYFSSIHKLSLSSAAILGYLEPLAAVLFAFTFLGENLGFIKVMGTMLIIGGAVISELNPSTRKSTAPQQM